MLRVEVLGQLLLMQSVLINLPDVKSIYSFVCRGLMDIPGVKKATFHTKPSDLLQADVVCFPMGKKENSFGEFRLEILDIYAFMEYDQYLRNFMFMIEVILEERQQQLLIDLHQVELENRVKERTWQLTEEIEERKRVEESLQESYAVLRIAGEKAKLGGWSADLAGKRVFWSDQVALIHEMPAGFCPNIDEAINFYAPEFREHIRQLFDGCANKGIPFDEELQIITAKGKRLWVRSIGEAEKNEEGKIEKVHGAFQDITERKQAEEQLRLSEEKYRNFIEGMQDGVYRSTPEGRFVDVNMAMVKMLGYETREDMMAVDIKTELYFAEQERESVVLNEQESELAIFRLRKKDGTELWVQDHGRYVYDDQGNVLYHEGILRDITKQLRNEEILRQVEIDKESAKLKQNFLANMSHEIRTPLTGILGMMEILEQTKLSEKQREYTNIIKLSGENLKEIINQVLDFSKIEAGKVSLKPVTFEPRILLNDVKMLYGNIIKKGVKLEVNIDPRIPEYIVADRNRIGQIINNLVSNAIKFTSSGSVKVNAVLHSELTTCNRIIVKIEVSDTGIGIPEKMQKKLFTPFSQVDENDARVYEGTGLGLSICKELANLLGGEIGMHSEHHKGSTFWFTFPARITMTNSNDESRTHSNAGFTNRLKILFAEDKVVNQKVVSLMLQSMGHEVTLANEGEHALKLFEPGKFDLILMDIQMPVMDGITATRMLKEKYDELPPIVGLSANAFEGDREKYMSLGMDEYLTKPIKKDDFSRLMQKVFS